jgi:cytosine/adenosine deaminase-related metal-dependent hydrolase
MILRAKWIVPVSAPPIEDGAVVIEGDTIAKVGRAAEIPGEKRDLGEVVLAPGLINAHCHLDYTDMAGQAAWHGSFIEWLLTVVSLKKQRTEDQFVNSIRAGMKQLLDTGTTTVVNVESYPGLIGQVEPAPLRVWWCPELIDFHQPELAEQSVHDALALIEKHPNVAGGFGLSPHAPYTAGEMLYRFAAHHARERGLILTTHLAESEQEDEMFRFGAGPMYEYLKRSGRDMSDCKRIGPVQLLSERGVLGKNCLAVHANCLTAADVRVLAGHGTTIVHCPKSHRFFQRKMPLLFGWMEAGINVCLGTDSMASNDKLNMFAEMQTLAHVFPRLSAEEILRMATLNPAKALNRADKLGQIAPGAWADLIAVPLEGGMADSYEAFVFAEKPVCFAMIGGRAARE